MAMRSLTSLSSVHWRAQASYRCVMGSVKGFRVRRWMSEMPLTNEPLIDDKTSIGAVLNSPDKLSKIVQQIVCSQRENTRVWNH